MAIRTFPKSIKSRKIDISIIIHLLYMYFNISIFYFFKRDGMEKTLLFCFHSGGSRVNIDFDLCNNFNKGIYI